MDGVNVTDAGTLAALRGVGYGGYGHQGNFSGDGSAVNANVLANGRDNLTNVIAQSSRQNAVENQLGRVENNLQRDITAGNAVLTDRIATGDSNILNVINNNRRDDQFQTLATIMNANNLASVQRDADQARQVAECCCELKAGQATIIANQNSAALAAAQAEAASLRVIVNQRQGQG